MNFLSFQSNSANALQLGDFRCWLDMNENIISQWIGVPLSSIKLWLRSIVRIAGLLFVITDTANLCRKSDLKRDEELLFNSRKRYASGFIFGLLQTECLKMKFFQPHGSSEHMQYSIQCFVRKTRMRCFQSTKKCVVLQCRHDGHWVSVVEWAQTNALKMYRCKVFIWLKIRINCHSLWFKMIEIT